MVMMANNKKNPTDKGNGVTGLLS